MFRLVLTILLILFSSNSLRSQVQTEVSYLGGTLVDSDGNDLVELKKGESILVFDEYSYPKFKVQYKDKVGYLSYASIELTSKLKRIIDSEVTEINYKGAKVYDKPKGDKVVLIELKEGEQIRVFLKSFESPYFLIGYKDIEGFVSHGSLVKTKRILEVWETWKANPQSSTTSNVSNSIGSGNNSTDFIKWYIEDKWPGDYSMQEYEIKKIADAMKEWEVLLKNYAGIPEKTFAEIAVAATNKWKIEDAPDKFNGVAYDWPMVVYEIKKQVESYKALHQR